MIYKPIMFKLPLLKENLMKSSSKSDRKSNGKKKESQNICSSEEMDHAFDSLMDLKVKTESAKENIDHYIQQLDTQLKSQKQKEIADQLEQQKIRILESKKDIDDDLSKITHIESTFKKICKQLPNNKKKQLRQDSDEFKDWEEIHSNSKYEDD